jgi:DNA replication protein DnaC
VELWPAVEAQKNGLLAIGPPGTGKTHLAVAMGRALIESKGATLLFYEQRELLKALQSTYDGVSGVREAEILRTLMEAEVLILDDLGAGRTTPWARDVMHDIIVQRYNDMKPLILTSNLATGGGGDEGERSRSAKRSVEAPLTLRDRLGDALMSRLYEMCEILRLEGTDYRIGVRQHGRSC